jgi:hypothetical protein
MFVLKAPGLSLIHSKQISSILLNLLDLQLKASLIGLTIVIDLADDLAVTVVGRLVLLLDLFDLVLPVLEGGLDRLELGLRAFQLPG